MKGNYKIAGHVLNIDSIYDDVHNMAADYRTDEPAEYIITTTGSDIEAEKAEAARECQKENIPEIIFPDGVYEFTAIYRKIVEKLFDDDILLFHGSVVAVKNEAYMFIAKSGTGKSTHSRMWRELFGDEAVMVNDDKPLVKITHGETLVYGTPWNGKHRLGSNIAVPLKGICILNRGEKNSIRMISLAEAYPMLLQQTYRIPDKQRLKGTMELIDVMSQIVRFYTMECTISTDAAKMAYEAMRGDK